MRTNAPETQGVILGSKIKSYKHENVIEQPNSFGHDL